MRKIWLWIFCKHRNTTWERNIYGDEIIYAGWKRSLWKCADCGELVARDELYWGDPRLIGDPTLEPKR